VQHSALPPVLENWRQVPSENLIKFFEGISVSAVALFEGDSSNCVITDRDHSIKLRGAADDARNAFAYVDGRLLHFIE
jgi:hypothetical protein